MTEAARVSQATFDAEVLAVAKSVIALVGDNPRAALVLQDALLIVIARLAEDPDAMVEFISIKLLERWAVIKGRLK
jgi:hypothetical protein